MDEPPKPELYRPLAQAPSWMMTLALRTSTSVDAITPALKRTVADIDPRLPVDDIGTLQGLVRKSMATQRFHTQLLSLFAALALGLAACGIYGVTSFGVSQRVREFAIHLALGAHPSHLQRRVVLQGLLPIGAGVAGGLAAALLLTQLLKSALFQTSPRDPLTLAAVAVVLASLGALAAWMPARRTARVDPLHALRNE
jgi:putative ABC transport system permease protein